MTERRVQRRQDVEAGLSSGIDTSGCPECRADRLIPDDNQGGIVCEGCGLIVSERNIDRGPEWRAFDQRERDRRSRVGAPTTQTMHEKGLTTSIDWRNKDAYGKSLSDQKRRRIHRLRQWQERVRTQDAGERNLQVALSEINRMGSALGVPKPVREVAAVIYRRALNEDLIRGRSIEAVASSSLYAACRQEGIPRSLAEVVDVSRVPRKHITRSYRHLLENLSLALEPVDPKEYVPRFCSELDLSSEMEGTAREIIDTAAEAGLLSGKSPTGFAGAAVYGAALLCDEKRTQHEVARVARVTVVTIRNRYQEQLAAVDAD